ncbi:MAG TPA: hypothetical protein VGD14_07595, partial [bacterium]
MIFPLSSGTKNGMLTTDTYKQFFSLSSNSSGISWYQIGYSCRSVLIRFSNDIFNTSYIPEGQNQPKGDDACEKIKWTTRYY